MEKFPLVSVIIPLYNNEEFIQHTLESVLFQTFTNFEIILIDDASTDHTIEIVQAFSDPRIRLLRNIRNLGIHPTRNRGTCEAKGKYIAILDADDLCHPERLSKQFQYMEEHPETAIVASLYQQTDGYRPLPPTETEDLKVHYLTNNYLLHSSLFLRRVIIEKYNLYYDTSFLYAGDYDFLARAFCVVKIELLQERLVLYRCHAGQTTQKHRKEIENEADRVRLSYLKNIYSTSLSNEEKKLHLSLFCESHRLENISKIQYEVWEQRLLRANEKSKFFNFNYFLQYMERLISSKIT